MALTCAVALEGRQNDRALPGRGDGLQVGRERVIREDGEGWGRRHRVLRLLRLVLP